MKNGDVAKRELVPASLQVERFTLCASVPCNDRFGWRKAGLLARRKLVTDRKKRSSTCKARSPVAKAVYLGDEAVPRLANATQHSAARPPTGATCPRPVQTRLGWLQCRIQNVQSAFACVQSTIPIVQREVLTVQSRLRCMQSMFMQSLT